jgi:NAD-dependent histone deacetylase SIR2
MTTPVSATVYVEELSGMSSPLSSAPSLSPAPPDFYPTPSSSSQELLRTSSQESLSLPAPVAPADECPPAKKRKIAEPKPRTTAYLDLRPASAGAGGVDDSQKPQLDLLLKVLRRRRKIVVIAGAGISVSAGSMCIFASASPIVWWVCVVASW